MRRRPGLIAPILVGPAARIKEVAAKASSISPAYTIVDAEFSEESAEKAVAAGARRAAREALMKGSLHTDELMGAVVRRDTGLRTARRISHCFVMDVPGHADPLIITDAAVNIAPTLKDKVDIVQNAIDLAHDLGVAEVRVAILSAMETVNPDVPSTLEAAALCKMADRRQITGAVLDGPLALDNAISPEAAKIKKIDSPVAGRANVLVVPDLEAGNMLAKSLTFLAGADAAGIVLGARVPIILTSRADSLIARLASCAVAALVAARAPHGAGDCGLMSKRRVDMLKGKSAIVTGSTSGIGLGIARALAAQGANLMLNGFGDAGEIERLRAGLAAEFKVKVGYHGADMSKPAADPRDGRRAARELGAVDILVNNAGIQHTAPVEEFPDERWDAVIAINLSSSFHAIKAALPQMRQRNWGRIINIASVHGLVASTQKIAYIAAKHGVVGLTKVIALETATTGITCNAICPGWVLTPLVQKQIDARAAKEGISVDRAKLDLLVGEAALARIRHAGADRRAGGVPVLRARPRRSAASPLPIDGAWSAQ